MNWIFYTFSCKTSQTSISLHVSFPKSHNFGNCSDAFHEEFKALSGNRRDSLIAFASSSKIQRPVSSSVWTTWSGSVGDPDLPYENRACFFCIPLYKSMYISQIHVIQRFKQTKTQKIANYSTFLPWAISLPKSLSRRNTPLQPHPSGPQCSTTIFGFHWGSSSTALCKTQSHKTHTTESFYTHQKTTL